MTHIDHYNDPDAPRANSLVPGASAVVVDEDGRILLHRRSDNQLWSIPGGAMEIGETIARTVVREVREETGLQVQPERLVGIYSDPNHVVEYPRRRGPSAVLRLLRLSTHRWAAPRPRRRVPRSRLLQPGADRGHADAPPDPPPDQRLPRPARPTRDRLSDSRASGYRTSARRSAASAHATQRSSHGRAASHNDRVTTWSGP